jgi:DNA mismatch endonuclease, patch repair protein
MAAIKSKGNRDTELRLISIFRANGITGWRRNHKLPGKPDFTFLGERLVVFVDGCFWHGCPRHCRMPKSRRDFWFPKIKRNKMRDRKVNGLLRKAGWKVLRVWEHELGKSTQLNAKLARAVKRS